MRLISKTRERQQNLPCVPREDQIHSLPQDEKKRELFECHSHTYELHDLTQRDIMKELRVVRWLRS